MYKMVLENVSAQKLIAKQNLANVALTIGRRVIGGADAAAASAASAAAAAQLNIEPIEFVEDQFSDKVLTLMKRATEDIAAPPPRDALSTLSETCNKQSEETVAAVGYLSNNILQPSSLTLLLCRA